MPRHFNQVRGERHHSARLNEAQVIYMRKMHYDKDICVRCVAKIFDIPYPTAWDAINYQTWRHVG